VAEICERLPDEFHDWVKSVCTRLVLEASHIHDDVLREFTRILRATDYTDDRKTFALEAVKHPLKAYLFMAWDGKRKELWPAIWKTLRPVGNKTVTTISEDVA
jgi:RNA ligase